MGVKISELTSATSLTGSEELPIVQAGNTKKTTIESLTAVEDITSQVTFTANSGITIGNFKVYKTGGIVIFYFTCTYASTSNRQIDIGTISGINTVTISGCGRTYGSPAGTTVTPASFQISGSSVIQCFVEATSQGAIGTIIMPYIPANQTRSANLTMNTGSLVGSGEKSNLLLEDFSGDKEDTTEEVKEDTTEELQENKEAEGSGDDGQLR